MNIAISAEAAAKAKDFLENEKQFHLGMLPTEQSNPKTRGLDEVFAKDTAAGVRMLFSVDEDIIPMAKRVFASDEFAHMLESSYKAINGGGRIIFSGCGATGRLSILLESMWRVFFRDLEKNQPALFEKVRRFENSVLSIMTGGDYALIKSVESFEDYPQFGRRQAQELKISSGDILIGITEGGETSSVLGSIAEALDVDAKAFLMFNNPADILCKHIERSRKAIENPDVTVLDLYCGPMAIAGSTRMQATSSEQLVAGGMLEKLLALVLHDNLSSDELALLPGIEAEVDYAAEMQKVIDELETPEALAKIAEYVEFEEKVYRKKGLITYFVDEFLIDIFTDTTERSPTFSLPPFRKFDDTKELPSPAFVKTPRFPTAEAWKYYLSRDLRCLEWMTEDYIQLKAPESIIRNQPAVSSREMLKFLIGNEPEACRYESPESAAVSIFAGSEFTPEKLAEGLGAQNDFKRHLTLIIGNCAAAPSDALVVPGETRQSCLKLMDHMKVKLVLNTVSSGVMTRLDKVKSNWMSFVSMSNKKLIDRCIRLISELAEISYEDACKALFQSVIEIENTDFSGKEPPSPVQFTLNKLVK
jgi:N-acetylmuramic acid 6-phosphate etherase